QFLNYKPIAKWFALLAAFATGLLYVAFLCGLGLFADLLVTRGHIPAYRDLTALDREAFLRTWEQLPHDERRESLIDIGASEARAAELAKADVDGLRQAERSLLWRAQIYRILDIRVGPIAAAFTLPGYRELPPVVQEDFQKSWRALDEAAR